MTQQRLIELTHRENETGNRNTLQRAIIQAERVFVGGVEGAGDIIHAAGVRFGFPSSAPNGAGAYRVGAMRWSLWRRYWK